jgi:hypothetical protein
MGRTKDTLKGIPRNHESNNPETSSRHLPTAPLRIAGLLLAALPFPGAEAAARPILRLAEEINVRDYSIIPDLTAPFTSFFAVDQNSRHDARVSEDLNRHIDHLICDLDPISKMDRSQISPDLATDILALIRFEFIANIF